MTSAAKFRLPSLKVIAAAAVAFVIISLFLCVNPYLLPPWATWIRAELGDGDAQSHLAFMYYNRDKDPAAALKWWKEAVAHGRPEAAYNVGLMYHKGEVVPQDDAEAVHWYRIAAEAGFADAQHNLGASYADGRGVQQSNADACRWLQAAAAQGFELSIETLRRLGYCDTGPKAETPAQPAEPLPEAMP